MSRRIQFLYLKRNVEVLSVLLKQMLLLICLVQTHSFELNAQNTNVKSNVNSSTTSQKSTLPVNLKDLPSMNNVKNCNILTAVVTDKSCSNNHTKNPSDDKATFTITVTAEGDYGGYCQIFGLPLGTVSIVPGEAKIFDKEVLISALPLTLTIKAGNGVCEKTLVIDGIVACSPADCIWSPADAPFPVYASSTITRNCKGTTNEADDEVSGVFTIQNIPAGFSWDLDIKTTEGGDKQFVSTQAAGVSTVAWGPVSVSMLKSGYPSGNTGFVLWFMASGVADCLGDLWVIFPECVANPCTLTGVTINPTTGTVCSTSNPAVTVALTATANGGGSGLNYAWTGSGTSSTNSLTATTAGTYTVTVSDPAIAGCSVSASVPITQSCPAECSINAAVSNKLCNNNGTPNNPNDDTFTFDVLVTGTRTSTEWHGNNVTGVFGVAKTMGPFAISDGENFFTITDGTTATCTIEASAIPPATCSTCPAPNPVANGVSICSGNTAILTSTGCNATYPAIWYSDATLSTQIGIGNNLTIPSLITTTNYYVACVKDSDCKSAGVMATATVNPKPTLKLLGITCAADFKTYSVEFISNGTVDAGHGTVSGNIISGIPIGGITITATLGECTISIAIEAPEVCPCPLVNPPVGVSKTICGNIAIPSLTVTVGIGESANWYDAAGVLRAGNTTSYLPTVAGSYFVEAFNIINDCKSAKTEIKLIINALPTLTLGSSSCSANLSTYSVAFISNGTVTTNKGTISGNLVTGVPSGETVILTATSLAGCTTKATASQDCLCSLVNPPVGTNKIICAGTIIPEWFVAVGPGESANWYDEAGVLQKANSLSFKPTVAGICLVEAYNTTTGCKSASKTAIRLIIVPKSNAGLDQSPVCSGNPITRVSLAASAISNGTWIQAATNPAGATIDVVNSEITPVTGLKPGVYHFIWSSLSTCADTVKITIPDCGTTLKGTLGDFVWRDTNRDGLQNEINANGGGVKDVQIELYKDGTLFAKDTTDATGKYLFINLNAGKYKIKVLTASIPLGSEISSKQDILTNDEVDSDINPVTGFSNDYIIDPIGNPATKDIRNIDVALALLVGSDCVTAPPTLALGSTVQACIGAPYPTLNAVTLGATTVDWYKESTGGTAIATGTMNYTPTGNVAANDTFYLATRSTLTGTTCPAIDLRTRVIVVAIICAELPLPVDLALLKKVDKNFVRMGENVTFTISVLNEGKTNVTGVSVLDVLPKGFQYISHLAAIGTSYTATTGLWNIGNVLSTTDTLKLMITAKVLMEGVQITKAEIQAMNGIDKDSTPGNNSTSEDDQASICVSVPIEVCDNKPIKIELSSIFGFSSYAWYRNGVLIQGATAMTYIATEDGDYTFVVSGGTIGACQGSNCCPIRILKIACPCEAPSCVPITSQRILQVQR